MTADYVPSSHHVSPDGGYLHGALAPGVGVTLI